MIDSRKWGGESFSNGKGIRRWREGVGGDEKGMKVCYVGVPTPHRECNANMN